MDIWRRKLKRLSEIVVGARKHSDAHRVRFWRGAVFAAYVSAYGD